MSRHEHDPPGERPLPALRALADVKPPPSLVAAVMREVSEPRKRGLWSWLVRPRRVVLRASPLAAGAALAGAVALWVALSVTAPERPLVVQPILVPPPPVPATGAPQQPVMVRFVLSAHGARHVALAGTFNDWTPERAPLFPVAGSDLFAATVPVPPGTHEYMFVVDGAWVTDPAAEERRPDGFGRQNALLRL